jgi:hypothetical protein
MVCVVLTGVDGNVEIHPSNKCQKEKEDDGHGELDEHPCLQQVHPHLDTLLLYLLSLLDHHPLPKQQTQLSPY